MTVVPHRAEDRSRLPEPRAGGFRYAPPTQRIYIHIYNYGLLRCLGRGAGGFRYTPPTLRVYMYQSHMRCRCLQRAAPMLAAHQFGPASFAALNSSAVMARVVRSSINTGPPSWGTVLR